MIVTSQLSVQSLLVLVPRLENLKPTQRGFSDRDKNYADCMPVLTDMPISAQHNLHTMQVKIKSCCPVMQMPEWLCGLLHG